MTRAESEIERLVRRAPGASQTKKVCVRRGVRVAELIHARFACGRSPRRWRVKHLRWVLEVGLADYARATKYDYWRAMRVLGEAMGRWDGWEPHLRGPWAGSSSRGDQGGRPPKLPSRG